MRLLCLVLAGTILCWNQSGADAAEFKIAMNLSCNGTALYQPQTLFPYTVVTWSEASLGCASTGGVLLPHDIHLKDPALFDCLNRSRDYFFHQTDGHQRLYSLDLRHTFFWVGTGNVGPYCNAIGFGSRHSSISLDCDVEARFLCMRVPPPPLVVTTAPPVTTGLVICTRGYTLNGTTNTCHDDDECQTASRCGVHATCVNTLGSYSCHCSVGYSSNPPSNGCMDVDECALSFCSPAAICSNSIGSFTCSCNMGYTGNGLSCRDINECLETPCHGKATCTNSQGSFSCGACAAGYTGNGIRCTHVDECALNLHNCAANAACADTVGSWTCTCNKGFVGNGRACNDINECGRLPCSSSASCSNTKGSYTCRCLRGYSGDGINCTDINECNVTAVDGGNPCGVGRPCVNTLSSYECPCQSNYTGVFECKAPATSRQFKTIISISSGVGAGCIALIGLLLTAAYIRSHNEVNTYLKQVILATDNKPFQSQMGAVDDHLDDGLTSISSRARVNNSNSVVSLDVDSAYATFRKESVVSQVVHELPGGDSRPSQEENMYVQTRRQY